MCSIFLHPFYSLYISCCSLSNAEIVRNIIYSKINRLCNSITGGLAAPLIGVGAAVYGTLRSTAQVIDKGTHGESLNPITDSEARMLWLGIGANLLSFGAMGASMRMAALAAKGKNFTAPFCALVNVLNGSAVAAGGAAILNSTILMIQNWESMAPHEILMQGMSIAFWTKGVFSFKPASTIIRETRNMAINASTKGLNGELLKDFGSYRAKLNNDAQMIRFLHANEAQGFDALRIATIIAEMHNENLSEFRLNADGSIRMNNLDIPMSFFGSIRHGGRLIVSIVLQKLNSQQISSFSEICNYFDNDYNRVFHGLGQLSNQYDISYSQAMEGVIKLWDAWKRVNTNTPGTSLVQMSFNDTPGQIVLSGRGRHVFELAQVRTLSTSTLNMIVMQLPALTSDQTNTLNLIRAKFQDMHLFTWIDNNSMLYRNEIIAKFLDMQHRYKLFTDYAIVLSNRGAMIIQASLRIGLTTLNQILRVPLPFENNAGSTHHLLRVIKSLPNVPANIKKAYDYCRTKLRLRFEHERQEAFKWFGEARLSRQTCDRLNIHAADCLRYNELDRLITMKLSVTSLPADIQSQIVEFAHWMLPNSISEFASYVEFCICYYNECVDDVNVRLDRNISNRKQILSKLVLLSTLKSTF